MIEFKFTAETVEKLHAQMRDVLNAQMRDVLNVVGAGAGAMRVVEGINKAQAIYASEQNKRVVTEEKEVAEVAEKPKAEKPKLVKQEPTPTPEPTPKPEPEKSPSLTYEGDVVPAVNALAKVSRPKAVEVLAGMGVKRATELTPEQWPELISKLQAALTEVA